MSGHDAPRVFVTYSHDSPDHVEKVQLFARFLRTVIGLDVRLDQWDDDRRRDWSLWAIDHLREADYVLVIASPEYKRRADGLAPPDKGRGAQFEAAMIRDNLTRNQAEQTERFLPVVFPGRSLDDIPSFLNPYSTTRFRVNEFTEDGVADLIAAITGRARFPMPERGHWAHGEAAGSQKVLLANGLPWLSSSAQVRVGPASINGVRYEDSIVYRPKTLGTDSVGFVEIDLGVSYRRLTAVAGVLDDAAEPFQVGHFRIFLDGVPQPEMTVSLGKPSLVDLDITGALKMRLEMCRPNPFAERGPAAVRLPELAWGGPKLA
ncbi:NPCBM/NEW2 domain-containing protein [Amycolatopsis xylanica]|uniref:NPCBM/NEW2 domain-containing protein n=1 Tax=Amycolatopsis xylanica TaxID=589385 RepID=A0A1H2SQD1_9PSEU|nr:SEFIR domain-containing protein [Amycolatopsis xylanica]SDW33810.1 NPCBM/NEW2 domain-containing protein [Amycolatopsis xylanica]